MLSKQVKPMIVKTLHLFSQLTIHTKTAAKHGKLSIIASLIASCLFDTTLAAKAEASSKLQA
jgi:hypothetical protein